MGDPPRRMGRRGFAAAGAALLGVGCSGGRTSDTPGMIGEVLRESGAPALAGAVVTRDGLAWLDAGGVRRAGSEDRVTRDDLWHIGSNTKAMTAAVYARLAEQGRARWGAVVPELFGGMRIDPAWARTSIEDLLSHRAGVSDSGLLNLRAAHADTRTPPAQRRALAERVFAAPPSGRPGAFNYGNVNYVLAGAALEAMLGTSWEEAVAAHLFGPLNMVSAGFGAPKGAQPWGHSNGLFGLGGGPVDPAGLADNPPLLGPAGRVHLSLADYARFVRVFLSDGGAYLAPESLRTLVTPPEGGDYALGWGVSTDWAWARGPGLGHAGSNTMWFALAKLAPARGIGVLAVSNVGPPKGEAAARALADRLIAQHTT